MIRRGGIGPYPKGADSYAFMYEVNLRRIVGRLMEESVRGLVRHRLPVNA